MANEEQKTNKTEEKKAEASKEQKQEEKKAVQHIIKHKQKLQEAVVRNKDLAISMKHAISICNFIKNSSIDGAVRKLEQVVLKKRAIPMHGEIPHRKGMMSGRYPVKAALQFIKLLKNLAANASLNGLDLESVRIAIAKTDTASRTRYNRRNWKFKRAHVTLIAKEMKTEKEKEAKEKSGGQGVPNREPKVPKKI